MVFLNPGRNPSVHHAVHVYGIALFICILANFKISVCAYIYSLKLKNTLFITSILRKCVNTFLIDALGYKLFKSPCPFPLVASGSIHFSHSNTLLTYHSCLFFAHSMLFVISLARPLGSQLTQSTLIPQAAGPGGLCVNLFPDNGK